MVFRPCLAIPNSDRSPLYDVRNPARASRKGSDMRSDVSRTMFGRSAVSPSSLFRASTWQPSLRSACRAVAGVASEGWWSQTGSNRRPHACKARALPAELWPRTRRRMLLRAPGVLAFAGASAQQPSFKMACRAEAAEQRRLVGLGRLELPTSRLSSARSNQLSYKPVPGISIQESGIGTDALHPIPDSCVLNPDMGSSAKKEK